MPLAHDRLVIVPCDLPEANAFVDAVHRHHKPVRGHRWSLAVRDEEGVRGIATIGRPVGRQIDQRTIVEVLRVATDGRENACSALYGASCRQQRAHGYAWAQTYTLLSEPGTSLRAAGWKPVHVTKAENWHRGKRPRDAERHPTERKLRWECPCSPNKALPMACGNEGGCLWMADEGAFCVWHAARGAA